LSFFLFLFFVTSFSYKFFTNCSLHSADMSFGFLLILLSIHLVKIKFSNIPRKECISVGSLWTSYIINATRNENNISFHITETSLVECYSNLVITRISIQTAGLAFGGTGLCSYRARRVDGCSAEHLTVESYTVVITGISRGCNVSIN